MSLNSPSSVATESNLSLSSNVSSTSPTTACDDHTCSTAKCVLCLHCSQQYCFIHFLKHNEQLSLNAYNFTLAIDQLEDQIKILKLDESLRRTIHQLDQWRKNLIYNIEYVYQEKLSIIKANYLQLSTYLQQFQLEQTSQIKALRVDLEQMKFIRSTYDQEMNKIQCRIKELRKNVSELQYDLQLKECQKPNIYDSIGCEIIWKRHRTIDDIQSTIVDGNDNDHDGDDDIQDYSINSRSTRSPTSYEHCFLSFVVANDSLISKNNITDIKQNLPLKNQVITENKQINSKTTILKNKKRRICTSCGKSYHPSSLQRHYRQCKHQSAFRSTSPSNSKSVDQVILKTVSNAINQQQTSVNQ